MRRVKIFISSPGDVQPERVIAERVIQQLAGRYASVVVEPVLWENSAYDANRSFQEQIVAIREMDVVVGILWKRVGSELPPNRFHRGGGEPYESGTIFELEVALACDGDPPVYVFKKTSPILFTKEGFDEEKRQCELLDAWWNRTFHDKQRHFLRGYEPFATPEAFEARLALALQEWLEASNLVPRGAIWDIEKASPFPGLTAYDQDRASVFFGRALATGEVIERLLDHAARPGHRPVLFVIGASGSGKSSLARAGIVPRLTTPGIVPGVDDWGTIIVEPSADVMARLAEALFETLPALATGPQPSREAWQESILARPQGAGETVRWALDRLEPTGRPHGLLLLLDQLETLLADPNHTAFAAAVNSLVETAGVWMIATLRTDRYAVLQNEPMLSLKRRGVVFDLPPPGPAEIAEIVRGSERATGLQFEKRTEGKDDRDPRSLADELVAATPNADALPLLQMSLARLFAKRQGSLLCIDDLDAMDGVPGAIAARAEEIFKGLSGSARGQLRPLVEALTSNVARRADSTVAFTTRVADATAFETTPARAELVSAFVDARLLVRDKEGALRVAHEAILRRWQGGREALEAIADAELRRARRRQLSAVAAALALVILTGVAGWQSWKAQRQLDRANEALATGLWNDLDFANPDSLAPAERMALWTLAVDGGPVRAPFVAELSANTKRIERFGQRPEAIARALGLGWPAPQQARDVLGSVLDGIKGTTEPYQLQALAAAVQALAGKLDGAQAQAALGPLLDAIKGTTEPDQLPALAEAVQALAGKVDAAQVQAALGPLLDAIKGTTEPDQLQALAEAVQALPVQLDGAQAQAALGLLDAIKGTTRPYQLQALAGAVQASLVQLDGAQAQASLATAQSGLAWALYSYDAAVWARALVVLSRANPKFSVAEIVEGLKYPTSAGPATDVLLDALHGVDPNAPGKEAGLAANLAWLRTAYPAIDLNAPPVCPAPLPDQQDVTCPPGKT